MTSPAADSDTRHNAPDLAVDFAHFASNLDAARLDDTVLKAVKTNVLDTLSCALASSSAKAIAEVSGMVREWGGAPQADMFVFGGKFPAHHAAWINGGMSRARDYDDTYDGAILHAGVTAVPAAIAAAELRGGVSGADLIAAVAAGPEVTCRLGVAIQVVMSDAEFASKTTDCATFAAAALPTDTAARLIATSRRLETLPDIAELLKIMTPP
jgi:2-methylcitrate dehydratase PrpD